MAHRRAGRRLISRLKVRFLPRSPKPPINMRLRATSASEPLLVESDGATVVLPWNLRDRTTFVATRHLLKCTHPTLIPKARLRRIAFEAAPENALPHSPLRLHSCAWYRKPKSLSSVISAESSFSEGRAQVPGHVKLAKSPAITQNRPMVIT